MFIVQHRFKSESTWKFWSRNETHQAALNSGWGITRIWPRTREWRIVAGTHHWIDYVDVTCVIRQEGR